MATCTGTECTLEPTLAAAPRAQEASDVDTKLPAVLLARLPWSTFEDRYGNPASVQSLRRPLAVFSISAPWCRPCQQMKPMIRKLHDRYAEEEAVLDIVHCGLDWSHADHHGSLQLPYYRFAWTPLASELPRPMLPEGVDNPHWVTFWMLVKELGKVGIPTTIVVDTKSGRIVERAADLCLRESPSDAELARYVALWRQGRSASTFFMRARFVLLTWYYVARHRFLTWVQSWIVQPFRKLISGPPSQTKLSPAGQEEPASEAESSLTPSSVIDASHTANPTETVAESKSDDSGVDEIGAVDHLEAKVAPPSESLDLESASTAA